MMTSIVQRLWRPSVAIDSMRGIQITASRKVHLTPAVCAEPMKKKKKLDPALLRMQAERRRKRLEKQIKKLERHAQKLKPIDEFELHREIAKDVSKRERETDATIMIEEVEEQRAKLTKQWGQYICRQERLRHRNFAEVIAAQEKALYELKIASPELHSQAVKIDECLLPFTVVGPCETPPIEGYIKDGQYIETTRSYELDPQVVQNMLKKNS